MKGGKVDKQGRSITSKPAKKTRVSPSQSKRPPRLETVAPKKGSRKNPNSGGISSSGDD